MAAALDDLRRQLREKFPRAHAHAHAQTQAQALATRGREEQEAGERPWTAEFFPSGAISEVIPEGGAAGMSLLVAGLLGEPEGIAELPELVLIDGGDGFDPASFTAAACSRLLWVRCRTATEMLKAADLLVRDGNLSCVLLDASGMGRRELRIPAAAWWRLKLAAEESVCRLVVLAPFPLVPCASLRVSLTSRLSLADFERPRGELLERLRVVRERRRKAT